ncbi:hypothetical protein [Mesorhizobium sp. B2-8-5]|uniref:hypothetical protein n=1 Tax=Mesorhizobium sp. B2-8-5 TaxID=2589903 RepID=UPI00112A8818|nr:hypothetical protein [Mesorhizobium sp. B2-8-5]UCI23969.1 hypothetical protein FJ430_20440 [Mesorhizobium sp. B2-8-5]
MFGLRIAKVCRIVAIVGLVAVNQSHASEMSCTNIPICDVVFSASKNLLGQSVTSGFPETVLSREIVSIKPVTVPDFLLDDPQFVSRLKNFDKTLAKKSEIDNASGEDLWAAVGAFAKRVLPRQITPQPGDGESDFKAAKALLVDSAGKPTKLYLDYKAYEDKHKEAAARLLAEKNESSQSLIRIEIAQIDRDWELFGNKVQVDAALSVIESFKSPEDVISDFTNILGSKPISVGQSLNAAASATDWINFGISSNEIADIEIQLRGVKTTSAVSPRSVTFSARIVSLDRDRLYQPFLLQKDWTTNDGTLLSAGGEDGKPAAVGMYVSGLVVVKNVEIFSETTISSGSYTEIVGLGAGATMSAQSNYLISPNLRIIGVVIETLKRLPSNN